MLNRELFDKDPLTFAIPNDGVSKVGIPSTDKQWQVLRYELESFVCEGEYARGLQRILDSYLNNADRSTQPAVWVSGFYGSGKSHLVRVLQHLWADTRFPDGASARGLVANLASDLTRSLTELDTLGRRWRTAPWTAAGSLDAAGSHDLNHAVLAIVLDAAGLPTQVAPARVVLWLRTEGLADAVAERLRADGRELTAEARHFNLSVPLAQAIIAERPAIATDPRALLQQLKNQFIGGSLTTAEAVDLLRAVLSGIGDGTTPPALLVVDEVQQYINDNPQRALEVQGLAQALTSQFDGRVLLVATGQQELTANPELQKIQDRFSVKVHLENQDVDEVVRRVLLQKKPSEVARLSGVLASAAGEIGRELQGARLQHRESDGEDLHRDYPLLPARRRFWDAVLRAADQGGRAGQLRSQLRVVHEANRHVAPEPVGTVVEADFLYRQKSSDMNAAGKLSRDVQLLIAEQTELGTDGPLRSRILAALQLISLLPTEGPADPGVRPTAAHVADLLVRDLDRDGASLRQRVPVLLAEMARQGVVQQDGDHFVIQTEEGRTWADDYRGKRAALSGDTAEIAAVRDRHLHEAIGRQAPPSVPQGTSKGVNRRLDLHFSDDPPELAEKIPVWVRSEWHGLGTRQFAEQTRALGDESPVVCVYLPRRRWDELRDALLDMRAAQLVLETRPTPTTVEGEQAKRAMETRLRTATSRLATIIEDVAAQATVELAGGAAPEGRTVSDRIRNGAIRAVARLFSQFQPADDDRWSKVIDRLKDGNEQPLEAIGYTGPVEQQPAVAKVLAEIGTAQVSGKALLDRFTRPRYGWSTDTVRAVLGTLLASGVIAATNNESPLDAHGLMGLSARIGSVQFRRETVAVSRLEQIRARSIAGRILGQRVSDDESAETSARRSLDALKNRAARLTGPAPLPEVALPPTLDALGQQSGNALVKGLVGAGLELDEFTSRLTVLEQRSAERLPALDQARRLAAALGTVAAAAPATSRLRALEESRELLAADDHIGPILRELSDRGRAAITEAADAYETARTAALTTLDADAGWSRTGQSVRDQLLERHQLLPEPCPALDNSAAVIQALQSRPLAQWIDRRDALASRAAQALEATIRLGAPSATSIGLPGRSIDSEADLVGYLDDLRTALTAALAEHGTIVVRGS